MGAIEFVYVVQDASVGINKDFLNSKIYTNCFEWKKAAKVIGIRGDM